MSAIAHLVAQTKNARLLRARPLIKPPARPRVTASETVKRYGPMIQAMRADGLTYAQIGAKLDMASTSASSFLSRYRSAKAKGNL